MNMTRDTDVAEMIYQCGTVFSILFTFALVLFSSSVAAEAPHVIEYGAAVNVIGISSDISLFEPVVTSLNPNSVRVGASVTITATGTELENVQLTSDESGLDIIVLMKATNKIMDGK